MLVKPKPTNNPCEIGVLVDISSPLISSQDPSKAKKTKKSIKVVRATKECLNSMYDCIFKGYS